MCASGVSLLQVIFYGHLVRSANTENRLTPEAHMQYVSVYQLIMVN